MKKFIYFDNAATTQVLNVAALAAVNCFKKEYGNPSSLHCFGLDAEKILNSARRTIAKILNCDECEIVFTPSATISTNLAILCSLLKFKHCKKPNKNIVTTQIEHPATKNCLLFAKQQGFILKQVQPINYKYSSESIIDTVDDNTCLVSLIHVNNVNGLIIPIEKIITQIKLKYPQVLIHIDCVQSFVKLPIDLAKINADFVSISGHKINAPKGSAVLFVRKNLNFQPVLFGGGQEFGICPGTQNVAAIAGFEKAASFHFNKLDENLIHYKTLKNLFIEICSSCDLVKFNFEENFSVNHIVNISIMGVRSQIMLNFLEQHGFLVSSGSACARGKQGYVLKNLGYGSTRQDCSIRVSFSIYNKKNEVEALAKTVLKGAKTLTNF